MMDLKRPLMAICLLAVICPPASGQTGLPSIKIGNLIIEQVVPSSSPPTPFATSPSAAPAESIAPSEAPKATTKVEPASTSEPGKVTEAASSPEVPKTTIAVATPSEAPRTTIAVEVPSTEGPKPTIAATPEVPKTTLAAETLKPTEAPKTTIAVEVPSTEGPKPTIAATPEAPKTTLAAETPKPTEAPKTTIAVEVPSTEGPKQSTIAATPEASKASPEAPKTTIVIEPVSTEGPKPTTGAATPTPEAAKTTIAVETISTEAPKQTTATLIIEQSKGTAETAAATEAGKVTTVAHASPEAPKTTIAVQSTEGPKAETPAASEATKAATGEMVTDIITREPETTTFIETAATEGAKPTTHANTPEATKAATLEITKASEAPQPTIEPASTEGHKQTTLASLSTTALPQVENATKGTTLIEILSTSGPIIVPTKEAPHPSETALPVTMPDNGATPSTRNPRMSDFDCSTYPAGDYSDPKKPCDTIFYKCVSPGLNAYIDTCSGLYFDNETKQCDQYENIPACSGHPRPTTPKTEPIVTLPPQPPVIDCHNVSGYFSDPEAKPKAFCGGRYFSCVGGREIRLMCPQGLYYDIERNECDYYERVYACSGKRPGKETTPIPTQPPTLPPVSFDCRGKKDGYYADKCNEIYYSCVDNYAYMMHCPPGLVFDETWQACDAPHNTFVCSGTRRPPTLAPVPTSPRPIESTTPLPFNCDGRNDALYPDPRSNCSRVFFQCSNNRTFFYQCPGNLYWSVETRRCELYINVFDCSGVRPVSTSPRPTTTPKPVPTYDFDCSRRLDGNYENPKSSCSHFYYICSNMRTVQQFCAAGLYYNNETGVCDGWANIVGCSGTTKAPTVPTTTVTTLKPDFDCTGLGDGYYVKEVKGCSNVYYNCFAGRAAKFHCPSNLFFDLEYRVCDNPDYIFACSGKTRPPMPTSSLTTQGPTKPTEKPALDCGTLADGEYPDPLANNKCSHYFYSCSSGIASKRECADGTYYDPELKQCDDRWNIPACTGSPRPIPTTGPSTTRGSPKPPPAFDCTKLAEGNYPSGLCQTRYWSCTGGLTTERSCSADQAFDPIMDECNFKELIPECGGKRPSEVSVVFTLPTIPPGGFDCERRSDGIYVNPENECSTFYYACSNGITSRFNCDAGLFYDKETKSCNARAKIRACNANGAVTSPPVPETAAPPREPTVAPIPTTTSTARPTLPPAPETSITPLPTTTSRPAPPAPEITTAPPPPVQTTTAAPVISTSKSSVLPETTTIHLLETTVKKETQAPAEATTVKLVETTMAKITTAPPAETTHHRTTSALVITAEPTVLLPNTTLAAVPPSTKAVETTKATQPTLPTVPLVNEPRTTKVNF